jgi:hypothetical protein
MNGTYIKKVQPGTIHVDEQIIRLLGEDWVGRVEREWDLGMVGVLGYHKCFHGEKSSQHSGRGRGDYLFFWVIHMGWVTLSRNSGTSSECEAFGDCPRC